MVPAITL